jgi:deazaflavin-dependent oxidoreductase (nitroreductase family)
MMRRSPQLASVVVANDLSLKALNMTHRWLLRLTGGRVGWRAGQMSALELTTTGRRTGQPRSVMLTSPVQEGETWVIVASRGGNDHHPAWFLNLRDHPDVKVSRENRPNQQMRARIATPHERARLWPQVTATYKGYAEYQQKTSREIPLVLLEPQH